MVGICKTYPRLPDRFPDVDVGVLVGNTVSYTDAVPLQQQPVVNYGLYVRVEEACLLVVQLKGHHMEN